MELKEQLDAGASTRLLAHGVPIDPPLITKNPLLLLSAFDAARVIVTGELLVKVWLATTLACETTDAPCGIEAGTKYE